MWRAVERSATGTGNREDISRRDLILGVIDNLSFYDISRFLITLSQTDYAGHVCLFAGPGTSGRTASKIRSFGVEVIRYRRTFPFIDAPHPDNVGRLPAPIHLFNFRHYLYYDYVLKHDGCFRNILITDVRDVVFQLDPFAFQVPQRIHVAMESTDIPLQACACTSHWVRVGYGERMLRSLRGEELSCAGTTLAPASLMKTYLESMLNEISRLEDAFECADQAAHNVLIHRDAFGPLERLYNFRSPVLTVGTEVSYRLNEQQQLINLDGSVINIVHQYDRHDELVAIFDAKVRPSYLRRTLAKLVSAAMQSVRICGWRLKMVLLRLARPGEAKAG